MHFLYHCTNFFILSKKYHLLFSLIQNATSSCSHHPIPKFILSKRPSVVQPHDNLRVKGQGCKGDSCKIRNLNSECCQELQKPCDGIHNYDGEERLIQKSSVTAPSLKLVPCKHNNSFYSF